MAYIAYLHKDRGSDFGVSFPDFPGCVTAGRTLDEARQMAGEALALHVSGMLEDGDPIPVASTLDQLRGDPAMKSSVAFLVDAEPAERTVRVNITLKESQVKAIDRLARAKGMTRSAYMVQVAVSGRVSGRTS